MIQAYTTTLPPKQDIRLRLEQAARDWVEDYRDYVYNNNGINGSRAWKSLPLDTRYRMSLYEVMEKNDLPDTMYLDLVKEIPVWEIALGCHDR